MKKCLIWQHIIDKSSFSHFSFWRPGTQHRARWMSSCIYSLKILLLQNQLEIEAANLEKLQSFGKFVAVFYSSMWFRTPLASEAAYNDLVFYKKMLECQTKPKLNNIFERLIPAMNRHLWYLTEELLPFALCSTQLAHEEKEVLARKLFNLYLENQHKVFELQKPIFPHITQSTQMSDLVGKRSVLLLQHFKFSIDDVQFLRRAHNQWFKYDSCKRLEQLVMKMKVTNDTAERGIKILEDYTS